MPPCPTKRPAGFWRRRFSFPLLLPPGIYDFPVIDSRPRGVSMTNILKALQNLIMIDRGGSSTRKRIGNLLTRICKNPIRSSNSSNGLFPFVFFISPAHTLQPIGCNLSALVTNPMHIGRTERIVLTTMSKGRSTACVNEDGVELGYERMACSLNCLEVE